MSVFAFFDIFNFARKSDVPVPAQAAPPGVRENSSMGDVQRFARENHTHASKARKARLQTAADGTLTWTYRDANGDDAPFAPGVVPRVSAIAETAAGNTDVINVQVEDTPGNATCKVRVTRTQRSVVSLIGLTVLSIPASPGATWVHLIAIEP